MHHVVMCVYVVKDLIPLYIKALNRLFPCVCVCMCAFEAKLCSEALKVWRLLVCVCLCVCVCFSLAFILLSFREGIQWEAIDWMDNAECLDLIEKVHSI